PMPCWSGSTLSPATTGSTRIPSTCPTRAFSPISMTAPRKRKGSASSPARTSRRTESSSSRRSGRRLGGAPLDQQVHGQHLHSLATLVQRSGAAFDEALAGPARRRPRFEHLRLHVQLVARPDRALPRQLVSAAAEETAGLGGARAAGAPR